MLSHRHLAAAALLCVAAAARADVPADARREIASRYRQMDEAYVRKNLAGIEQAFAPDCTLKMVGEPMRVPLAQFLDGTRGSWNQITVLHSRIRTQSLKSEGAQVVATISWTRKSRFPQPDADPASPKTIVREGTQTIVDTWAKTPQGWKIQRRLIKPKD